jgi:ribonuclease-3
MPEALSKFETTHALPFRDQTLLRTAFVHSSYVNESGDDGFEDNERLEFLGDAVVGYVVSEILYQRFPDSSEGELTSMRAALVRRESLARYAQQLDLGSYLFLGHGEEESGGRLRMATLCATFEAVVGAIFLDLGVAAVRGFVLPLIEDDLAKLTRSVLHKDAKSRLQEWSQSNWSVLPRYRVVDQNGPDHAKSFVMQVMIAETVYGVGLGPSKQEASQAAAAMALARLGEDAPEYVADEAFETRYIAAANGSSNE